MPAIVLVNVRGYNHFVVLEGIRDGWVLLSDPANGMRSEPIGEFEAQWSGIFFLILTNAERAQQAFNNREKWAAAPAPPWELTALHDRPRDAGAPGDARSRPVLRSVPW